MDLFSIEGLSNLWYYVIISRSRSKAVELLKLQYSDIRTYQDGRRAFEAEGKPYVMAGSGNRHGVGLIPVVNRTGL